MKIETAPTPLAGTIAFFLFGPLLGCQPDLPSTPDADGPSELVEEWVAMWNSYDLDDVSRLFLNDDRVTYFSSEREGVIRGLENLLEHHRGFGFVPGGVEQANRLWVEDLGTDLLGDVAVMTGIWLFQREGEPSPQRGPVTFVCIQQADGWRFAHMTFSEYLPPDTL
jgi:ketosteroid isomerase-like protein